MSLSTEQMSRGVVFRGKRRKIKIGTLRNFSFWGLRKVFWLKAAQKKKTHCWLMSPYMSEGGRHSTRCPTFFVLDRQISCESSSSRRLWNTGSRGLSGGINETPITQSKGKVFFLVCRAGNKQDKNSTSIWSVWSGSPAPLHGEDISRLFAGFFISLLAPVEWCMFISTVGWHPDSYYRFYNFPKDTRECDQILAKLSSAVFCG